MARMSYLVLARKYRPRTFEQMVGQEHVVQALANALERQRLHHAYLFTGTRGVGKTTVARILAKSLNCTGVDGRGGITAQPCGTCAACTDIDAGRFVDYLELDAASNRGVEEISQLLDQAIYKPVVGRFKVYMIDEVHMLSATAFNAMLKTLEEPPEYLKFVLATTDPQKVPVTVLSRCLQFNLRPMAADTVQAHLARVLAAESIEADAPALRLLARAAHGSMRDALSLADQAIAYGAGRVDERSVRQMLGAADRGHAVRLIEAIGNSDGAALLASIDELRNLGLPAAGVLEEIALLAQQMAVVQAVPDAVDESDPGTPAARRLAGLLAADETQLLYAVALHGRAELPLAPDEYSGLVMVLLRVLAFRRGADEVGPAATRTGENAGAAVSAGAVASAHDGAPVGDAPERPAGRGRGPTVVGRAHASAQAAGPREASPRATARGSAHPPPWVDTPSEAPIDEVARTRAATVEAAALPPADGGLVTTPLGDRWDALVRQLSRSGAIAALVRELAMQAECLAFDDAASPARVRLRVERESLRADALQDKLAAALGTVVGQAVLLDVEPGVAGDSPARRETVERARRQHEAERLIHDDPLVQDMMRQFATARIVPGSVKPH
jgi:DNA polymerase-3 subunit gamma/tau